MALRYLSVSAAGDVSETENDQSDLITAADAAIDDIGTANAEAGSNADVTTEVAAAVAALAAVTANQPSGGVVITLNTSTITTLNKLREVLDAAYSHIEASNILT